MAVVKDKWGVKLQHPERKCQDCKKFPCFVGIENTSCLMAAYGCKYYKD